MGDAFSFRRFTAIARKEVIQLRRDPRSLLLAFAVPVILLVIFGYAISWDIRDIALGVLDQDQSARSRAVVDAFRASGYFTVEQTLVRPDEIRPGFERDAIQVVLVIPPGFASALGTPGQAAVQLVVDGSDANTATIILAYSEAILIDVSHDMGLVAGSARLPLTVQSRIWYNEELQSRDMVVPGLVAVIMAVISAMLTSLTIAREWERGTMEQLASTPVSRLEVILGKLAPYVGIGLIDIGVTVVLGMVMFGVPFRGNPFLLLILSLFFLIGALGFGIFISAAAKTQVLATQVAMVATYLPALLLSGFMFSIDAMPRALQLLTFVIPARYYVVVTRGIFLKGVGIEVLRVQGLLMIAFAVIGLGLAVIRFRKEIA